MERKFINPNRTTSEAKTEDRSGMSETTWNIALSVIEVLTDITKGFMVVGGVIAATFADVIMGTISASSLLNPLSMSSYNIPSFGFGTAISLGTSAIQIFMWSLISRRGVSIKDLFTPKRIPKDIRNFLYAALVIWLFDTTMDVAPLALLLTNKNYIAFPVLYKILVFIVGTILLILCGFSEILTSNMRAMLQVTGLVKEQKFQSFQSNRPESTNKEMSRFNNPVTNKNPNREVTGKGKKELEEEQTFSFGNFVGNEKDYRTRMMGATIKQERINK